MKPRKALKIAFSVLLLASLAYIADWRHILSNIRQASIPLYLTGVSLFLTTYLFHGWRWKNLSNKIGLSISFLSSVKIIAISYGFNTVFPGNSGDLVRSKIVETYHEIDNHGSILGLVALERFLDACAVVAIVLISGVFLTSDVFGKLYWILVPFLLGITAFGLGIWKRPEIIRKLSNLLPEVVNKEFSAFIDTCSAFKTSELLKNFLIALSAWLIEALVFYILSASLGLEISFAAAALVTSVISLISSLPISPGGLGVADVTATGLLVFLGLNYSDSVSLVILQRSIGLGIIGLTGGLVYFSEEIR